MRANPEEITGREAMLTLTRNGWGQDNPAFRQLFATLYIPGATEEQARWFNALQRISASPEGAVRQMDSLSRIDVRHLLGQVRCPTLVLHCRNDAVVPLEQGLALARAIPNAQFVALESSNHLVLEEEPAWGRLVSILHGFFGELERDEAGANRGSAAS